MSEQQRAGLDATLRQAPLDLNGDLASLRSAFEEVIRHIPIANDVRKTDVDLGGVGAVEVDWEYKVIISIENKNVDKKYRIL
jgi:hypothetical protein